MSHNPDVIIVGGGASGLMCAIEAGRSGLSVLVLEKNPKIGLKILVSGGGRCNFTNSGADPRRHYLSANPRFCISAMQRYPPGQFIEMVDRYGIAWHEKKLGQLFCDDSAKQIVTMLQAECDAAGVTIRCNAEVERVTHNPRYSVSTSSRVYQSERVVLASGGLSLPKVASDIAFKTADGLDVGVEDLHPALVPFTWNQRDRDRFAQLSGIAMESRVSIGKTDFAENILFTHRGLSGPAILQISSYWSQGQRIRINLLPGRDAASWLRDARDKNPKQNTGTLLRTLFPNRFVDAIEGDNQHAWFSDGRLGELSNTRLNALASQLNDWEFTPGGTEGYRTAEVTLGGISTKALSSKTFELNDHAGLYAIGEAVDVTGWLGGYNFQWAWASGWCCAQALIENNR